MKSISKPGLFVLSILIVLGIFFVAPHPFEESPGFIGSVFSAYPAPGQGGGDPQPPALPAPEQTPIPYVPRPPVFTKSIEEEIDVRHSLGFRTDLDHIESIRASNDVVVSGLAGGVALSPAEANELAIRIDIEKDGETLINYFESNSELRSVFGGIYLDHARGSEDMTAGGKLVLQLVQEHKGLDDVLTKIPSLIYPERLQTRLVKYSSEHLDQQYRTILAEASKFNEIQTVSKHDKTNRVIVGVSPSTTHRIVDGIAVDKDSLSANLSVLVEDQAVIVVEEEIIETTNSRVMGGFSWSATKGQAHCSLGFEVEYNGSFAMLTAGHCINEQFMSVNDNVYHIDEKIGTWTGAWRNGSITHDDHTGFDAAILMMNDFGTASDDILDDTHGSRDIIGSTSNYVEGYWRCFHGYSSGSVCGEMKCTDINYRNASTGLYYNDMFSIDPVSIGGDSGSAAYRPELIPTGTASVTGIMRSIAAPSCANGDDSMFSKWDNIMDYWDLTLVTESEISLPLLIK